MSAPPYGTTPFQMPMPISHQPGMQPGMQPGILQPGMQPIATGPAPGAFNMPMAPPQNVDTQGGWSVPNTICPPGLEYLMGLDHLFVRQEVELLEAFTGFETKNKYSVMNINGQPIYYVAEQSDCCSRMCCGSYRSCEFKVIDGVGREILSMKRPLRCDSCWCACCLQEMEVYSGGVFLGSVTQDWSIFRPWFSIRNSSGDTVLRIKGPWLRCCVNVSYEVNSADGEHRVGMISKQWSGLAREFFSDSDNFGISFPMDLDVKIKAVLLGACLLIDFMYFEDKN